MFHSNSAFQYSVPTNQKMRMNILIPDFRQSFHHVSSLSFMSLWKSLHHSDLQQAWASLISLLRRAQKTR